MITLQQISDFHSAVRSGADFPTFIQKLKSIGITHYIVAVENGQTTYFGGEEFSLQTEKKYKNLTISETINRENFLQKLAEHQAGKTDYLQFCRDTANSGIFSWKCDLESMICMYFDRENNEIFSEKIGK